MEPGDILFFGPGWHHETVTLPDGDDYDDRDGNGEAILGFEGDTNGPSPLSLSVYFDHPAFHEKAPSQYYAAAAESLLSIKEWAAHFICSALCPVFFYVA